MEALEYALTKSRELGVSNDCSKAATAILVKYKPDQYGPPLEKVPDLAPAQVTVRPQGHGLLANLVKPAPRESATAGGEDAPALPPLGAVTRQTTAGGEARDPDLPLEDVEEERQLPSRPALPPPSAEDEDLLK
ncbi:MAG: hypothetical protein A2V77_13330 [Anaeromyxobacter sp. RBG_16_69_14]|nr:MAG: hypothetical protein A2V77_13330 [Anaeromyxobacter sp. RBG_16_69_14]